MSEQAKSAKEVEENYHWQMFHNCTEVEVAESKSEEAISED